jgi:hypothetical protein
MLNNSVHESHPQYTYQDAARVAAFGNGQRFFAVCRTDAVGIVFVTFQRGQPRRFRCRSALAVWTNLQMSTAILRIACGVLLGRHGSTTHKKSRRHATW